MCRPVRRRVQRGDVQQRHPFHSLRAWPTLSVLKARRVIEAFNGLGDLLLDGSSTLLEELEVHIS